MKIRAKKKKIDSPSFIYYKIYAEINLVFIVKKKKIFKQEECNLLTNRNEMQFFWYFHFLSFQP